LTQGEERGEEAGAIGGREADQGSRRQRLFRQDGTGGAGERVDVATGRPPLGRDDQGRHGITPEEELEGLEYGIAGLHGSAARSYGASNHTVDGFDPAGAGLRKKLVKKGFGLPVPPWAR
jgi:hypothetical protein